MNQRATLIQSNRHSPNSLLGEMAMGILASMAIGTGFSILAGALVLLLVGGRTDGSGAVGTTNPTTLQGIVLSQAGTITPESQHPHVFADVRQPATHAYRRNGG